MRVRIRKYPFHTRMWEVEVKYWWCPVWLIKKRYWEDNAQELALAAAKKLINPVIVEVKS